MKAEGSVCRNVYERLLTASIRKDEAGMRDCLAEDYVLVHMTGMRQGKEAYIRAVLDGTLHYYAAETESCTVRINGDTAVLDGKTVVSAAVFGGGRHTWRLRQRMTLRRIDGTWKIIRSEASTY